MKFELSVDLYKLEIELADDCLYLIEFNNDIETQIISIYYKNFDIFIKGLSEFIKTKERIKIPDTTLTLKLTHNLKEELYLYEGSWCLMIIPLCLIKDLIEILIKIQKLLVLK